MGLHIMTGLGIEVHGFVWLEDQTARRSARAFAPIPAPTAMPTNVLLPPNAASIPPSIPPIAAPIAIEAVSPASPSNRPVGSLKLIPSPWQ